MNTGEGCNAGLPAIEPEVRGSINILVSAIERLEGKTEGLRQKLAYVSRSEVSPDCEKGTSAPSMSPLAGEIASAHERVEKVADVISEMTDRLEI